jgi:hypothetical protein
MSDGDLLVYYVMIIFMYTVHDENLPDLLTKCLVVSYLYIIRW